MIGGALSDRAEFKATLKQMNADLMSAIDNNDEGLFARVTSTIEELEQVVDVDDVKQGQGSDIAKSMGDVGASVKVGGSKVQMDCHQGLQEKRSFQPLTQSMPTGIKPTDSKDGPTESVRRWGSKSSAPSLTPSIAKISYNKSVAEINGDEANRRKKSDQKSFELEHKKLSVIDAEVLLTRNGNHSMSNGLIEVAKVSTETGASSSKFSSASWIDGKGGQVPYFQLALDTVRDSENLVYEEQEDYGQGRRGVASLPDFLRDELSFVLTDSFEERKEERRKKAAERGEKNGETGEWNSGNVVDSLNFKYSEVGTESGGLAPLLPEALLSNLKLDLRESTDDRGRRISLVSREEAGHSHTPADAGLERTVKAQQSIKLGIVPIHSGDGDSLLPVQTNGPPRTAAPKIYRSLVGKSGGSMAGSRKDIRRAWMKDDPASASDLVAASIPQLHPPGVGGGRPSSAKVVRSQGWEAARSSNGAVVRNASEKARQRPSTSAGLRNR